MENLDQYLMTEAFDSVEGFKVINMKPGSGAPQIFMIDNGNSEPLIVRMMALSTGGDKLRTIKPNDKNVIIELMSINDRGRHVVLQGGIGKDPMKTIVTIFDTVISNLNLAIVDSIMFRFQTKKMKGQARSVIRILERLTATRGKGKFTVLKEMENFTGKFSYVVMHKKRLDIDDLPGAGNLSDSLEKVETKVGVTYVDKATGKQVSKSEAVAESIAKTVGKISEREMVNKTRLSRQEVMNAQYGGNEYITHKTKLDEWEQINAFNPAKQASGAIDSQAEEYVRQINSDLTDNRFSNIINQIMDMYEEGRIKYSELVSDLPLAKVIDHETNGENPVITRAIINDVKKIISGVNMDNMHDKLMELASVSNQYDIKESAANKINTFCVEYFANGLKAKMGWWYGKLLHKQNVPSKNRDAIGFYCGQGYSSINEYLIGKGPGTATIINTIKTLDETFEDHYTKLPKGIKLYRGMALDSKVVENTFKSKVFYFRNYVSTSMAPMVLTGGFADVAQTVGSQDSLSTDDYGIKMVVQSANPQAKDDEYAKISMGVVIKGAEILNVIVPFKETRYEDESEVILPRGTAIKFDKIVSSGMNDRRLYSEATVIDPYSLTENETVYDGDALIETGEIKPLDVQPKKRSFVLSEVTSELENAEIAMVTAKRLQTLADVFANTVVPEKFMQC